MLQVKIIISFVKKVTIRNIKSDAFTMYHVRVFKTHFKQKFYTIYKHILVMSLNMHNKNKCKHCLYFMYAAQQHTTTIILVETLLTLWKPLWGVEEGRLLSTLCTVVSVGLCVSSTVRFYSAALTLIISHKNISHDVLFMFWIKVHF